MRERRDLVYLLLRDDTGNSIFCPTSEQKNKAVEPRYSVSHGSAEQGLIRAGDLGAPVFLCVLDPLLPPQEGACSWLCLALIVHLVCMFLAL